MKGKTVTVLTERVEYLDENGKLVTESLRDYSKNALRQRFASLDDFLRPEAERYRSGTGAVLHRVGDGRLGGSLVGDYALDRRLLRRGRLRLGLHHLRLAVLGRLLHLALEDAATSGRTVRRPSGQRRKEAGEALDCAGSAQEPESC